jgi:hypothetical protein
LRPSRDSAPAERLRVGGVSRRLNLRQACDRSVTAGVRPWPASAPPRCRANLPRRASLRRPGLGEDQVTHRLRHGLGVAHGIGHNRDDAEDHHAGPARRGADRGAGSGRGEASGVGSTAEVREALQVRAGQAGAIECGSAEPPVASSRPGSASTGSLIVSRRGRRCQELRTRDARRMSEPAKVFEDRGTPDQWRVEWFDDDGRANWRFSPAQRRGGMRCDTPCTNTGISRKSS